MESIPSRPARLSTAERKRLTDRKAQRQRRERIKTYIARLEKTVEELTAASGNGMEATLLKQLEQQRLKTERLTNVINHIHEVLEETRSSSSPGHESSPLLTNGESSASACAATSAAPAVPRRLLNPDSSAQQQSNRPRPTFTINIDLATKISLHSQNPSNSGTRNYFQVVNESISNVAKERNSILPSTVEDDDDLAIRAILNGWDSIHSSGRNLDHVWGLLQALDQGIFSRTGLVERAAILRLMRSMIKVFSPLLALQWTGINLCSGSFPSMTPRSRWFLQSRRSCFQQ
ncbi:bZIP transcription factor [Aspergillus lucknowensis]|uniref:BZIP domain-containing protein n=1 Tax=Aspergillus lucknowensis TaxID=176173 RepID=A0ABR4LUG2_9EURO